MNAEWLLLASGVVSGRLAPPPRPNRSLRIGRSLKSRARLVAAGNAQAGVEIELAPGAITYWRDPGEAGVPPAFDFSGSVNLKQAEVEFPAPRRIVESDGSEAFGYDGAVVFPIAVDRSTEAARSR